MRRSRLLTFTLAMAAVAALAGIGMLWSARPYTFHGSLIEPPAPALDFSLTDQNGRSIQLSDLEGKVVLLFFGYTSCPDVCPRTLVQFRQVRADLGPQAEGVRFVFISVDPEVDTPQRLREYLAGFDPTFIGATGSMAQLEPVWEGYGVHREEHSGHSGHVVDHTARIYAIDAGGNLRLTYTLEVASEDLAADVRELLKGG